MRCDYACDACVTSASNLFLGLADMDLSTNNISTLPGEWIPNLAIETFFRDTNLVTIRTINVKQNSKRVRLEMVQESHPPPLQLDADEAVRGDIITNGTVSIPENQVI